MIEPGPSASPGRLKARHHGPARSRRGALGVRDDDTAPGADVPVPPRRDVEIVARVREGATGHEDSLGNHGRLGAGDAPGTGAGTGIRHAGRSAGAAPARIFQIRIEPAHPRGDAGAPPVRGTRRRHPQRGGSVGRPGALYVVAATGGMDVNGVHGNAGTGSPRTARERSG